MARRAQAGDFDAVLARLLKRRAPAAQSLIVTVFGDSVSPHGGSLWLGSLIDALAPFGIAERAIRTSVYRLVQDGWLDVERVGRRAYYAFAAHGRREYERTARRVYALRRPRWDGTWTLAILHAVSGAEREALRTSLGWIGYGALATGVYAHPTADRRALEDVIDELRVADGVLVMEARASDAAALAEIARERWNVAELARRYRRYVADFAPLAEAWSADVDGQTSFVARTLLIHEWRRILLGDPDLPDALLPSDWPGRAAAAMTATLYGKLAAASSKHVVGRFVDRNGALRPADASFRSRFAASARELHVEPLEPAEPDAAPHGR